MDQLGWGLQMTVLGMGLVFALLALLWALLTLILALDKEETPEEADDDVAIEAAAEEPAGSSAMPADLISAITVAVVKHKNSLRGEAAPIMRTTWPGSQPSRWVAAGRVRQTNTWTPRGK